MGLGVKKIDIAAITEARLAELDAANMPADLDVVKADTPYIADLALPTTPTTGSLGRLAKDYLTGDAYARLGAPAGASAAVDIAAIKTDTASLKIQAHATGTQTATVTTEHFLSSPNVAGAFMLVVDMINMAANDVVELRAYQMVLTGGTARVVYFMAYYGAQATDEMITVSDIVYNELAETNAVRFSLKQTFGTGRAFPWKVLKHA